MYQKSVRVAVIQAASIMMNLEKTTQKAVELIREAGSQGAKLVLFPEAFMSGYPWGLHFGSHVGGRTINGRLDFQKYWESAVEVSDNITALLGEAARAAEAYVAMGIIEKERKHRTLYCTLLYFSPAGELLAKHRKLKPTGCERLIWGEGDGSTLPVIQTPFGRIGGLICFENYMPLARTAMYEQGVDIYLAPTAHEGDGWLSTMKHIAQEGRCFVLSCNQYVQKDMLPPDLACYEELTVQPAILSNGGSAIISPYGEILSGPIYGREEILYADLSLDAITQSRFDMDVVGHYSRPDVFSLRVNRNQRNNVIWQDKAPSLY